jgi:MFS family permease
VTSSGVVKAPAVPPPAGDPAPSGRFLIFGVTAIALFMASIDQTIVSTALGTLQHDLHTGINWASWTITIYALGQIVAMPVAGVLSDIYGRKRLFLAAVVLFTVASLCCGLATNIYELVSLRALQALGGGAFIPSATGIVSDQFGANRDRAIGMFTSIFPIGAASAASRR